MDSATLLRGARLAVTNAQTHCMAAEALAAQGFYGFATAHLVFAVEEAGKAHIRTDLALKTAFFGQTEPSTPDVRNMLTREPKGAKGHSHTIKQRIAATEAWSRAPGGVLAVLEAALPFTARFGKLLPPDWDGESVKRAGLYVDPLDGVQGPTWRSPQVGTPQQWEDLRPCALGCVQAENDRVSRVEQRYIDRRSVGPSADP